MKQFSPEYLRVRKEIARIIADNQVTFFTDCQNLADSILEIKGIAIIADDQTKPAKTFFEPSGEEQAWYYHQGQEEMLKSNFKKVIDAH
jgi:hypothetical protein